MNTNHYACANISAFHLYGAPFGMEDDDFIYPPDLLGSIDFEKEHVATYDPQLSLPNPGPNLVVRPLRRSDYNKGRYVLVKPF